MTGVNLGTLFAKLLLEDDFSATFQKYLSEQDKAQKKTQAVADGFKAAGAAATAFAAIAVNSAVEINKNMANVATLISGDDASVDARVKELKGSVQEMAQQFGSSTDDVAKGLYELISTLGDSADNAKILEINVKAAQAGLATTADAISFTTAVTKTYGDTSAEAFQKVSDLGFQTVNLGKTTFPELAQAIGRVAPLAKETGVSLEEMFAIIASQTGVTGNTNEVITQMSSAIAGLVSPNKELMETYQRMGVTSGEALIQQRGLVGALQDVAKAAKDTDTPLINLVGRKEAWVIASSLAGAQAENFSQKLKAMGEVAGATDTAFRRQTQGIAESEFQWRQWKASAEVAAQKVGDAILDHLSPNLKIAAVGFAEMSAKAIAYAGEMSQVVLAIRSFTTEAKTAKTAADALAASQNAAATATASAGTATTTAAGSMFGKLGMIAGLVGLAYAADQAAAALQNELATAMDKVGGKAKDFGEFVKQWEVFQNLIKGGGMGSALGFAGTGARMGLASLFDTSAADKAIKDKLELDKLAAEASAVVTKNMNEYAAAQGKAADATSKHSTVLNPFAAALKAVQTEVANLSATQRQAITDGTKLGRNAEEIANAWNKIPGAATMSTDAVQMFMNSAKEGAKETHNLSKELQDLKDKMLGLDQVKDAVSLTKILGGDAGMIAPDKLSSTFETVHAGLETLNRLGTVAAGVTFNQAQALRDLDAALKKAVEENDDWNASMKNLAKDGVAKVDKATGQFVGDLNEVEKKMKAVQNRMADRQFTQGLSNEFRQLVDKTREFVNELDDLQDGINNEVNPALQKQMIAFRDLRALDMGQEIGEITIKTKEFQDVLLALAPTVPGLMGVVEGIQAVGDKSDGASNKVHKFRGEIDSLKEAFSGDIGRQFAQQLVDGIVKGFESGGVEGAFKEASQILIQQTAKGIGGAVASSVGGMIGSFAGAAASAGVAIIFSEAYSVISDYITRESRAQQALADAVAARNKIIGQLGVTNKEFVEMLQRANLAPRQITALMEASDPKKLETAWNAASQALKEYEDQLKGLQNAASGAGTIGKSLGISTDASKTEQMKSIKAMQDAMIDAMEKAGAKQEEIKAQQDKFTEDNKNHVYEATQAQIDQYNRLGTITGGVIANMAGRTGDLIGAIMANKDALQQLIDTQNQFGLAGEKTSAATQQVIDLYGYIQKNEGAVTAIQGVTQVLNGMGTAMIENGDMANALGGELNAALQSMIDNGVATKDAFALAAPALQDLWEIWKEGKVTLDETTTAMLEQAEAQGVVGERMKDTNEQILDVLTEIRDMFSRDLPHAIERTNDAVQNSSQQQQNAHRRTAQTAQESSTEQQHAAYQTALYNAEAARYSQERWTTGWKEITRTSLEGAAGIKEKIDKIPKDFDIHIGWKVDPVPPIPDPTQGQEPPDVPAPPAPGDPAYNGAGAAAPGSTSDTGRGQQTIVVERDGQKDLQFTAENLPDYVRIRAGNTVLGV